MTVDLKELERLARKAHRDPLNRSPWTAAYLALAHEHRVLIAELEQAKKDAERYQWLRKSHHDDDSAIGVTREHMNGWGRVVGKSLRNSDLDKAIDEAIAKEQS